MAVCPANRLPKQIISDGDIRYDCLVITPGEFTLGLTAGMALIFFALSPDLFQRLAEEVRDATGNFSAALFPLFSKRTPHYEPIRTPRLWLAGMGIALIALSVLTAFSA
jgi:hypothetical protein